MMSDMFQRKPVMGQFDADGNLIAFEDAYGQRSDGSAVDADYAAAVVGAGTALRTAALHKPYGTADVSFNKTSGLSAAVITTCVKAVVNAPYSAIRLVSTNRGNQAITGVKALVAATETMASTSSSLLSSAVIGGTAYAVLAGATDQNGQRAVTYGGASSFDHAASSAAGPDLKLTDWQPLEAVARTDGGTGYAYLRKVYRKGDTNGNWAFTTLVNTPAPSTANRNRPVVVSNTFSDGVGTIGATYSLTATADDVGAEFRFKRPVFSVWGAGDSIMACNSLVTDKMASWLHRACEDVSTTARTPVVYANFGAAGVSSADYLVNVEAYLVAGVTPPSMLFASISINEIGSTPDVRKAEIAVNSVLVAADICRKYRIPYLCAVPMMPNENITTAILDAIRVSINSQVSEIAAGVGITVLDTSGLGDGASPELWIPTYKFDAVHPNETAIESVLSVRAASILRRFV